MKPLELTIYDKHPDADAYNVGGYYSPYCLVGADKRFRPGELAAEYHAADLTCWIRRARCSNYPGEDALWDHYLRGLEQMLTLERFATLPHYDEADQ